MVDTESSPVSSPILLPRRLSLNPSSPSSRLQSRSPTRTTTSTGLSGSPRSKLSKSPSFRHANPSKTLTQDTKMDLSSSTDEIPTASETLLDDLRTQVRRAEAASDEYQQEIQVLKARLDELNAEHMKLEDVVATKDEKIQSLEGGKMQAEKQNKALESTALKEQTLFDRKRDASAAREEELIETIQRLKESLFRKEAKGTAQRTGELSPPASFHTRALHPAEHLPRSSPLSSPVEFSDQTQIMIQKDHIIEALRLELADAHIRFIESENAEAGRINELERVLLEARMNNAKLTEDNESYQVLLREKTLNGHFSSGSNLLPHLSMSSEEHEMSTKATLADELEAANSKDDPDYATKLEVEISALKEQNKALTLYINKIITRLLQSGSFETFWENNPAEEGRSTPKNKENAEPAPSLLQRAGSVFGSRTGPRPQPSRSSQSGPVTVSSFHDEIMPSIRNLDLEEHTNSSRPPMVACRSDTARSQASSRLPNRLDHEWSANVVNNMYRSTPSTSSTAGRQLSPGLLTSPRQSAYFAAGTSPVFVEDMHESVGNKLVHTDVVSDSGYSSKPASETPDQPSPPRSNPGSEGKQQTSGNVLSATQGNKMRPLRLVQEKNEADEAALAERKRANRTSFMGWFGKPA